MPYTSCYLNWFSASSLCNWSPSTFYAEKLTPFLTFLCPPQSCLLLNMKIQVWHFLEMATDSSTLAWRIPWMEEPGRLQSMGLRRVGHNWVTSLSLFTSIHWRRKWKPTPVFLPGESQGRRSLVGCRLWGRTSQTQLKRLTSSSSITSVITWNAKGISWVVLNKWLWLRFLVSEIKLGK